MSIWRVCFFAVVLMVVVFAENSVAGDMCAEPVMTESGELRGMDWPENETCVWLGVPYAAAPVGDLRWQNPQPMPAWPGVREATEWTNRCYNTGFWELLNSDPSGAASEDCLHLHIWRPKKEGVFPVMFWVHGGGYDGGTANNKYYWGDRLAELGDVVVVSINYRLNVFGFFAHPDLREEDPNSSTGNYGSLDQVAALRWVHDNIAAFGGDPDNITIFGESAGGYSICTLLVTPLAEGLFHKAIMESGGCMSTGTLEDSYAAARSFAEELGCGPDDMDCMRSVPADKLIGNISGGLGGGSGFRPRVDDYFMSAAPIDSIRAGDYHKVPFIAGSNRDEFAIMTNLNRKLYYTRPAKYEENIKEELSLSGSELEELMAIYPLSDFNNKPKKAYGRMLGVDNGLACTTYDGLVAVSQQQEDTYHYRYDFDGYIFGRWVGSMHSMEIPPIFDSMDRYPISLIYTKKRINNVRPLSQIMQGYWINFAKTGDPNGPGLPEWPKYRPETRLQQVLDTTVRTEPDNFQDRCGFWEEYNETHDYDGH